MRRLLWLGVGLAVGALAVRAITKKAQAFTPSGIAGSVRKSGGGLIDSVRTFVEDVREGMAEREEQIHAAFAEGEAMHGDPEALDDFYVDSAYQEEGNQKR
jgi:hypothetical protein